MGPCFCFRCCGGKHGDELKKGEACLVRFFPHALVTSINGSFDSLYIEENVPVNRLGSGLSFGCSTLNNNGMPCLDWDKP